MLLLLLLCSVVVEAFQSETNQILFNWISFLLKISSERKNEKNDLFVAAPMKEKGRRQTHRDRTTITTHKKLFHSDKGREVKKTRKLHRKKERMKKET